MKIGIVADDLTGAADAVAPFVQPGLRAGVGFRIHLNMRYGPGDVEALALSTETREVSEQNYGGIVRVTRQATRSIVSQTPCIVKKIDSTLRGHLRLELDAMRKEVPERMAVICPAFPANGRTVESGVLYVYGKPLHESAVHSTVRNAFQATEETDAVEIPLEEVRQGTDAVAERLDRMHRAGIRTVFCDSVQQEDLQILAQALLRQPDRYLPVGSAGLSGAIAVEMGVPPFRPGRIEEATERLRTEPVVVAVGSLNAVSRKQASFLAHTAGIQPVRSIDAAIDQILAGERIALAMTPDQRSASSAYLPMDFTKILDACRSPRGFHMVVTGGATAIPILWNMYLCPGLYVLGEIQPGVVVTQVRECEGDLHKTLNGMQMVLKAGGFGEEQTLARCVGLAE